MLNETWMWEIVFMVIAASFGLLGAVIRQYLQKRQHGEWDLDGIDLYFEALIGAVAGFVMYLTNIYPDWRGLAVAALTAGLSAVDVIENLSIERE